MRKASPPHLPPLLFFSKRVFCCLACSYKAVVEAVDVELPCSRKAPTDWPPMERAVATDRRVTDGQAGAAQRHAD